MENDYRQAYSQIMQQFYKNMASNSIHEYKETPEYILLETTLNSYRVDKRFYVHVADVIDKMKSALNVHITKYRTAVMQYLSKEVDSAITMKNTALKIVKIKNCIKQLEGQSKNYVQVSELDCEIDVIIEDLLPKQRESMEKFIIAKEKQIKKKMNSDQPRTISDTKLKEFLFRSVVECSAHPSKTNNALSKEDLIRQIKSGIHKKNMPKSFEQLSKLAICKLLFKHNKSADAEEDE